MRYSFLFTFILLSALICGQGSAMHTGKVYTNPEVLPEFPGGETVLMKFVKDHLKYPDVPEREQEIQSLTVVGFVVNEDGSVSDVSIKRSSGAPNDKRAALFDNEALRVIRLLPKFKPGMKDNKPVRVAYVVPVRSTLE